MSKRGSVSFWNDEKGFGFICSDDGGEDLFCHLSSLPQGTNGLGKGDNVKFDVEFDSRKGNMRAINVEINGAGGSGSGGGGSGFGGYDRGGYGKHYAEGGGGDGDYGGGGGGGGGRKRRANQTSMGARLRRMEKRAPLLGEYHAKRLKEQEDAFDAEFDMSFLDD